MVHEVSVNTDSVSSAVHCWLASHTVQTRPVATSVRFDPLQLPNHRPTPTQLRLKLVC